MNMARELRNSMPTKDRVAIERKMNEIPPEERIKSQTCGVNTGQIEEQAVLEEKDDGLPQTDLYRRLRLILIF